MASLAGNKKGASGKFGRLLMIFPNYLNHIQNGQKYGPDLDRKGAQWLSA